MPYKDRNKRLACQRAYEARTKEKKAKRMKEYHAERKEHFATYRKIYNEENKALILEYRQKRKEIKKEYDRLYVKQNYKRIRARNKEYVIKNKDKLDEAKKVYVQKNRVQLRKKRNAYVRQRSQTDPAFKLTYRLRHRVNMALKHNRKSQTTLNLIGCSIEDLMRLLEQQFKDGMTWENYGFYGWHVDHKKPLASFDLSKPEEQMRAFHYSNLQPLWAKDNLIKGSKLLPEYASS